MAIPKVFISSTCYDLRQIRSDLESFVKSFGYSAILSDKHGVTYNTTDSLETDCYTEINNCDIVVGIIGGKYGSESKDGSGRSVSMKEMESAIQNKKQMYIFIETNVHAEFYTYERNIGKDILFAHVDDKRIFEFINLLKSNDNIIINDFLTVQEIEECLKQQWAGLFQNYLNNKERQRQNEGFSKINDSAKKLEFYTEELKSLIYEHREVISSSFSKQLFGQVIVNPIIVLFSKCIFNELAPFFFFKNKSEFERLLAVLGYVFRGYESSDKHGLSINVYANASHYLYIDFIIFNDKDELVNMSSFEISQYEKNKEMKLFRLEEITLDKEETILPF